MSGLLSLLTRKSGSAVNNYVDGDQYLDQASAVPASGAAQLDALRAIALYYELYQEQEDWRAAASALAKFASDVRQFRSSKTLRRVLMYIVIRLTSYPVLSC